MRPIDKGEWPKTPVRGNRMVFNDWTKAIPFLKSRTGSYCHLCELRVTNPIAIEHIKQKGLYPRLSAHWDNFLLSCNYCNSRKGGSSPVSPYRQNYFWPHLGNSMLPFQYRPDGMVRPSDGLSGTDLARAENTIALYKLNATKTATGGSDHRYIARLQAWRIAIDRRMELERGLCTVSAILDSAILAGFFSVWWTLFQDREDVKKALIECPDFHLADKGFFDASLQPIASRP